MKDQVSVFTSTDNIACQMADTVHSSLFRQQLKLLLSVDLLVKSLPQPIQYTPAGSHSAISPLPAPKPLQHVSVFTIFPALAINYSLHVM